MQYKIVDIKDTTNGFEVDVEFYVDNKKRTLRFAFTQDAWRDQSWRRTIERNLLNIKQTHDLSKQKHQYIGKTFTASEENTEKERPPAAIGGLDEE